MNSFREPLTQKQRAELEGIVAPSTTFMRAVTFLVVVGLVAILLRWAQQIIPIQFPLWLIPTLAFSLWLYRVSEKWTGGKRLRGDIRSDLASGEVTITVLEPVVVTEIKEIEDEGPSFIIANKTGELCILSGQEMQKYKSKKFPWSKIGVVRTALSNQFFELRCLGEEIQISELREPFTLKEQKILGLYTDSFVILNEAQRRIIEKA